MDPERPDGDADVDPESLSSAPVYQPQPMGCKLMICQVVGCGMSLEGMKGYFLRHRVCEEHSKSPVLIINGVPSRLCQQCSKFHAISNFEGSKRTCRMQLDRIRVNKRIRRTRKMNAAAAAALAATGICGIEEFGEQPAPPAGPGGGRFKRPADSSCCSGDPSWADSRKSRHLAGSDIARSASALPGMGGSGSVTVVPSVPASVAVEADLLPESGGSDSGSREHPRAIPAASDALRWQSVAQAAQCPAAPWLPATAQNCAPTTRPTGDCAVPSLADSPLGATHCGSGCSSLRAVGGQRANSNAVGDCGGGQDQQRQMGGGGFGRCDSSALGMLSFPCSEYGVPGSIAAAAAAAGLFEQPPAAAARGASVPSPSLQLPTHAAAPQSQAQLIAASAPIPGSSSGLGSSMAHQTLGVAAGGLSCGLGPGFAAAPLGLGETSGLARTLDVASPWATPGEGLSRPLRQPHAAGAQADAPVSASALHPLLQQQLLLQQQQQQQQQQQTQAQQQQQLAWPSDLLSQQLSQAAQQHEEHSRAQAARSLVSAQLPAALSESQPRYDTEMPTNASQGAATSGTTPQGPGLSDNAGATVALEPVAGASACGATSHAWQAAAAQFLAQAKPPPAGPEPHSTSKLARMSLENDNALADSDALLGSLIDLLQTQGTDPRDAGSEQGLALLGPRKVAPSAFSGASSLGSGSGHCELSAVAAAVAPAAATADRLRTVAAAAGSCHVSSGLQGGLHFGGLAAAMGASDASALSRAGSGAAGLPGMALLGIAAGAAVPRPNEGMQHSFLQAPTGGAQVDNPGGLGWGLGPGTAALEKEGAAVMPANASVSLLASGCAASDGLLASAGASHLAAVQQGLGMPVASCGDLLLQQQRQQQQLLLLQQQEQQQLLLHQQRMQQAQAQLAIAQPGMPAAGTLLSRLLDADTKTHHLSSELHGCLAEKQLLRRQLLATLACQAPESEHVAVAAMAAATNAPVMPQVPSLPALPATGLSAAQPLQALAAAAPQPLGASLRCPQFPLLEAALGGAGLGAGPAAACASVLEVPGAGLGMLAGAGQGLGGAVCGGAGFGIQGPSVQGLSASRLGVSNLGIPGLGVSGLGGAGLDAAALGAGGSAVNAAGGAQLDGLMSRGLMAAAAPAGNAAGMGGVVIPPALGPIGVPTGGGLLGAPRAPAAAQLQALADARAAVAAGNALHAVAGLGTAFHGAGAGAAAGVLGGGGSYASPELLTRMSLKIMNCLPDELPHDIRSRMQLFAAQAPIDVVQGCLRPGCTELVLDALHEADEGGLVAALLRGGDAAAAAAALLAALPAQLAAKELYLQLADRALCLRPGAPPRYASWGGVGMRRGGVRVAKPELAGVEEPVVHVECADSECVVRLRVYGRHLTEPGVALLARLGGLALPVAIRRAASAAGAAPARATASTTSHGSSCYPAPNATVHPTQDSASSPPDPGCPSPPAHVGAFAEARVSSSGAISGGKPTPPSPGCDDAPAPEANPTTFAPYDAYDVEVELPYGAPPRGLLVLEPRAGVLLGGWQPVLLLEDGCAAAEAAALVAGLEAEAARRLLVHLGLLVDHAERCAAAGEAEEAEDEEGAGMEAEGVVEEEERVSTASCVHVRPRPCFPKLFGGAHGRVLGMGRSLLAFCALRGCPQLLTYVGSALVEMGEPLSALPAASYGSAGLLACALLSGGGLVLRIAAEWAMRGGAEVDWRGQVPGQPLGANLLHLAAALPLPAARASLDSLWVLALSAGQQPAAADAFAAAWFADEGGALDAPCLLFRANIAASVHSAADALAAASVGDRLDRLCLLRLAAFYVRTHNFTSPLDNVELPSLESNSVAPRSSGGGSGRGEARGGDGGTAEAGTAAAAEQQRQVQQALLPSCGTKSAAGQSWVGGVFVGLDPMDEMGEAGAENAALADDGVFHVQDLEARPQGGREDSLRDATALARDALLLDAERSGHGSAGGTPPAGQHLLLRQTSLLTASPPRMRVVIAPKALAQTAAAAAAAAAAGDSWRDGASGSGADASLAPHSATTAATTTAYASSSLPAFASGMTAGMVPSVYGSSLASHGAAPYPMAPLLNMSRPLPGSPCGGAGNGQDSGACRGLSESGPMEPQPDAAPGAGRPAAVAEAVAPVRAAVAERQWLARADDRQDGGGGEGSGAGDARGVTIVPEAGEPEPEARRGHMRGLARMFKRLFKGGAAGGAARMD